MTDPDMTHALRTEPHSSAAVEAARILVVDDDEVCQRYAQRALELDGHLCTVAATAAQARARLAEQVYDVLVTDLQLPDGDGLGLLRHVSDAHPQLPVVIMTGYPSLHTAVLALRLQAVDYVTKPAVELAECVARVLRRVTAQRRALEADARRDWSRKLRELAAVIDDAHARDIAEQGAGAPTTGVARPAGADPAIDVWARLTVREREIARQLADGRAVRDIARGLGLSTSTVRNHLQSAFRRTGVCSQAELVARLRGAPSTGTS
jgi:DNA-binding NarL/FixJ family response regulator